MPVKTIRSLVFFFATMSAPAFAQHQVGLHVETGLHATIHPDIKNVFIGGQNRMSVFYAFTPGRSPIGVDITFGLSRDRFSFDTDPYGVVLVQRQLNTRLLVSYKINPRGNKVLFGFGMGFLQYKFSEIVYTNSIVNYSYGYSHMDSLYGANPFQVNICAGYHLALGKKQRWGIQFLLSQNIKSILLKEYRYAVIYGPAHTLVIPASIFPLTASIGIRFALNKPKQS